jgi:hypothetical protein
MTAPQVLLTVNDVAAHLNISPNTVLHYIRGGYLGHYRVNPDAKRPTYRVSVQHLDRFKRERERTAA